jgi:hypothetical protein
MPDVEYSLAPFQEHFITSDERVVSIIAGKGAGKAQPLTEPILTPTGWVEMGRLKKGDYVIGSNGNPVMITGVFPQGEIDCYKVKMSDGTHTFCSEDHLWSVQTGGQKMRGLGFKTMPLKNLFLNLKTSQDYNKWYLPLVEPVNFPAKTLPIPPYSLGAIIGDGGLTKREVIFSTKDLDILHRISAECEIGYKYRSGFDYNLTNMERDKRGYNTNSLVTALDGLGLMLKKSQDKFIPEVYLYGSVEQRTDLLRGLMDTDGYCDKRGVGYFTTTSRVLANQVCYLCRSLGLTTDVKTKKNEPYLESYNIRVNAPFNPFWISRKASRFNIYATQGRTKSIQSIEYAGKCEMQCISVDATDSLYVTRDFILTHNTWSGARFVAYQVVTQPNSQGLVMLNSRQQVIDIFDQDIRPVFEELNWPYTFNQQSLNVRIFGTVIHLRSADPDAVKKVESIAYHWGWADEASYYPPDTLKTFVSRIRKGKATVRVTSMPDEPDAFMYSFLENLGGTMYELGLRDNPDRDFADRYERFLRATYSGAQLERFLSGKRVSLLGEGLFAIQPEMKRDELDIDHDDEIILSWDFNVEYRAVSAWQQIGRDDEGYPIVACVRSWRMSKATVHEDAVELSRWFAERHRNTIYLHGDASGNNRSAQATESMWATVRKEFEENCKNVVYIVPKSNPSVKDTIQCLNWALRKGLVLFNRDEKNVYNSLSAMRADKYGEVDKSIDYKEGSSARTHDGDTARYAAWHYFKFHYPGSDGGLLFA